jgi:hypothetical protein
MKTPAEAAPARTSIGTPPIQKMAQALGGEVRAGQVLAPGPGHSAADRSLSVKPDPDAPDGFIVHSFAGDDPIACRDHVRARIGLGKWEPNGAGAANKANGAAAGAKPYSPIVATFVYRDQESRPYLRVQRTTDKQFFQSHWEDGTWKRGAPKGPKLPYLLPALIAAAPNMAVYITEGEGKADLLAKIGFIATSASGGAGKWTADLNKWFAGRLVRILTDNDEPGRRHGRLVARNLYGVAAEVRIVDLPGLLPKGDVKQWLETDPSGARLVQVCERAPVWTPVTGGAVKDEDLIAELAVLGRLEYAKRRKVAAKAISIGVGELDGIVADADATARRYQARL